MKRSVNEGSAESGMKKFASFLLPLLARRHARPETHPDADLLAAFAERKLSRAERTAVLAHLADCPDCREVLLFASAAGEHEVNPVSAARNSQMVWRLAAIAAVMFLVIAAGWRFALLKRTPPNAEATKFERLAIRERPPKTSTPPLELEKDTTQTTAVKKKRVSSRRARVSVPAPSVTPLLAQADRSDESRDVLVLTTPQRQLALPAPGNENSVAQREVRRYALQSNSMFSSETASARSRAFLPALHAIEKPAWSLEAASVPGAIRKSNDDGKTWRTIAIDGLTRFYALSVAGPDIWVGGAAGRLFHSSDDGAHWTLVPVIDGNGRLSQAIVEIEIRGDTITLKTSSGAVFMSNNAGMSWRRP